MSQVQTKLNVTKCNKTRSCVCVCIYIYIYIYIHTHRQLLVLLHFAEITGFYKLKEALLC